MRDANNTRYTVTVYTVIAQIYDRCPHDQINDLRGVRADQVSRDVFLASIRHSMENCRQNGGNNIFTFI